MPCDPHLHLLMGISTCHALHQLSVLNRVFPLVINQNLYLGNTLWHWANHLWSKNCSWNYWGHLCGWSSRIATQGRSHKIVLIFCNCTLIGLELQCKLIAIIFEMLLILKLFISIWQKYILEMHQILNGCNIDDSI